MKTTLLLFLLLISLEFISCNKQENIYIPSYNEEKIKSFVINAIKGDINSNDSLGGLIDNSLPPNDKYNKLEVREINSSIGKHFYSILLEYPNPVYNRFAVYDSVLNPVFEDKSLNGELSTDMVTFNGKSYLELKEEFLSKDILEISRLTLYSVDSIAKIAFRGFTRLITPGNTFNQTISEISNDRLRTDITSKKKSDINGKSDIFSWDNNLKLYLSNDNLFDSLVKYEIKKISKVSQKPEITDQQSALQSAGVKVQIDSIKNTSNVTHNEGFSITLTEGWKEINNISLSGYSDKSLKGIRYENHELGASFFIAELKESDKAEDFFHYDFKNVYEGKYKVRFTDKIEATKYFVQFFEFSCGSKKYVMVFEASKYTYDKYKKIYENITNSFTMDC